jgi:hypothetical protein
MSSMLSMPPKTAAMGSMLSMLPKTAAMTPYELNAVDAAQKVVD